MTPLGLSPSTPPTRLNTSGISGVTEVGMDLLDDQATTATASGASVVGTHIPAPSSRQNMQSPETHQLQQTLRNTVNEHLRTCSSSSNDGEGASAFSSLHPNNMSTLVETILEGGLDDDQGDRNLDNNVRIDLSTRLSNASNNANAVYESGLQGLVIDTKDPG